MSHGCTVHRKNSHDAVVVGCGMLSGNGALRSGWKQESQIFPSFRKEKLK
jgi:hypothetical protein